VVLDWGLAKVIGKPVGDAATATVALGPEESAVSDLTLDGQVLGTPAYMAPEQASGHPDEVDVRTDVYGLGAMLYEILTGRPPFSGDVVTVLHSVRYTDPISPSRVAPEVPPLLEAACLRALAKNPALRHASPTQLAEQVQQWQEVQRKQAEDALRASEALYHSLVETIPMNIWRKDASGRFTFANRGFCQTLGLSLEELIGKTDFDISPTELAEGYRAGDNAILATGTTYEAEEQVLNSEGQRLRIRIIKLPVRDGHGNIVGTQGIFWTEG
jgi:PAS domain S-box-containing protein